MGKFWTTQNKKLISTIALIIVGWHAIVTGGNPLKFPALPDMVTNPISMLFGLSLLGIAGMFMAVVIWMMWDEQV